MLRSQRDDFIHPASKVLTDTLSCNAADPKDKVYALYAFFKKQDIPLPNPDYGRSTGVIYWETTVAVLNQEHTLSLLLVTGLDIELGSVPS
jgi:hypothetical protein